MRNAVARKQARCYAKLVLDADTEENRQAVNLQIINHVVAQHTQHAIFRAAYHRGTA